MEEDSVPDTPQHGTSFPSLKDTQSLSRGWLFWCVFLHHSKLHSSDHNIRNKYN